MEKEVEVEEEAGEEEEIKKAENKWFDRIVEEWMDRLFLPGGPLPSAFKHPIRFRGMAQRMAQRMAHHMAHQRAH